MNEILNKLSHHAKHIHMSEQEKALIKSRLVSSFEKTPLHVSVRSPWTLSSFMRMPAFSFALVCFFVFGGLSFGSKNALPGEYLYGFKTHIYEPTLRSFAITAQGRTQFEISLLKTRLEESQNVYSENSDEARLVYGIEKQAEQTFAHVSSLVHTKRAGARQEVDELEAVLISYGAIASRPAVATSTALFESAPSSDMALKASFVSAEEPRLVSDVLSQYLEQVQSLKQQTAN